jgi:hypothetical protein
MNVTARQLEDDRVRRRNQTCLTTGVLGGATVGALAGSFAAPGPLALTLLGAVLGAVASRLIESHLSVDDWDPRSNHRPYVGTPSPDDDIASSSARDQLEPHAVARP